MNKYKNIKVEVDGIKFDSKREANFYGMLKLRLRAGEIQSFERQISYRLDINGVHVCNYIADFKIVHYSGLFEVIDVKSKITASLPVYKLKKRLMKACLNIDVIER